MSRGQSRHLLTLAPVQLPFQVDSRESSSPWTRMLGLAISMSLPQFGALQNLNGSPRGARLASPAVRHSTALVLGPRQSSESRYWDPAHAASKRQARSLEKQTSILKACRGKDNAYVENGLLRLQAIKSAASSPDCLRNGAKG